MYTCTNKGNFLALLEFRAEAGHFMLAMHFESISSRYTYMYTCTSRLFKINSYMLVDPTSEKCLKKYEKLSTFQSLQMKLHTCTRTSNCEQLFIVLQFVDTEKNVREEFVGFIECNSRVTREALGDNIVESLASNWQLNMQKLCGQAYDGAGAMAGKTRVVAAHIMASYPKATCMYTHCLSHVLNLCVVWSATIADAEI